MKYFKENPKALLDAIPTPRGEEEKLIREFKKGFSPKPDMKLSGSMMFKSKMTIG